jgi:ABC-type multidrug transport system fused ATPase/permease subunit
LGPSQKATLVLVSLGNTVASVAVVLPSVIIGRIVSALTDDASAPVAGLVALFGALMALFVILRVAIHVSLHRVLPKIEATLREAQLAKALMTPVSRDWAKHQYVAEQNSLMGRGAKAGADTVQIVFADLMPALTQAIAAVVAACASRWLVAAVLLASGVASTVITHFQLRSQGGVRVAINRAKARLDGVMTELLRGKAVIRTLYAAEAETARVGRRARELSRVEIRHHQTMGLFDAGKTLSESLFAVAVLIVAATFVAGGATPGVVLTLYLLFMQFMGPLRDIHRIRDELNESGIQLAEVFGVLDQPADPLFVRGDSGRVGAGGSVLFDHVWLSYGNGRPVVRGVSVAIPDGAYLGICGKTGCGKSTLVKALVGILPVDSGRICVGGLDVVAMSIAELASSVAYVSQEPYVISGTIRDNLLLGQPRPLPDGVLTAALEQVGLAGELDGLDGAVGEDGQGLSGGQRQRLVLARVLLRPAKVIVLDEATSALDNINEELFMRAVKASGKTVVAIAHRLSTLRRADQIIVMDRGEIRERGTYADLGARPGIFSELLGASAA